MRWRELKSFRDGRVPKLDHLRRAARAGLRVPPTVWLAAAEVPDVGPLPAPPFDGPWMVRSASPHEDGSESSAAGRFHSELIEADEGPEGLADAARRVRDSLVVDGSTGSTGPAGAVFLQPEVRAERAGVAFFDGFHYEQTWAPEHNRDLTSGAARGTVVRADLVRGEAWSEWLASVARAFPRLDRLDLEWALDEHGYVLLQVRRAAFALRRNPLVSLANHREILGEAPSPWIVSALDVAGREALGLFAQVAPEVAGWHERYARIAAGRAWMDFSAFFRLMDHWGLPRTFVTEGVGGAAAGPLDARVNWGRFLRSGAHLLHLQLVNLGVVLGMRRELARIERVIRAADDLRALHAATARGMTAALRTNFALGGALAGVQRLRRRLGVRASAQVVTGEMGRRYEELRQLPAEQHGAGLDAWLERFGHRGPLESDPIHPRFVEMRDELLADLARGREPGARPEPPRAGRGPLFWLEVRREAFRDELMGLWLELRRRLVAEGRALAERGELERPDDVFFLTDRDLARESGLAEAARAGRAAWERTRSLRLPHTARLEEVLAAAEAPVSEAATDGRGPWRGIGLCGRAVEGRVRRAEDLAQLLREGAGDLGRGDVLVVPALEPSWAVVFGRVGAVVAELGGELSHASILLRELGTPAVVNCLGCWSGLAEGARVRVDPEAGRVELAG